LAPVSIMGFIKAETPNMQRILKIFEPMTFPIEMSASFLIAATTDVANSGRLVPRAMIVNPIIKSEAPKILAMVMALFKNKWAPKTRIDKPPMINAMSNHGFLVVVVSNFSSDFSFFANLITKKLYIMIPMKSIKPSSLVMSFPIRTIITRIKVMLIIIIISILTTLRLILIGLIRAEIPSIKAMLQILEPTTLPNAMAGLCRIAAETLTTNSGALVPKPTIVNPTTRGAIPLRKATDAEPFTKPSAPK